MELFPGQAVLIRADKATAYEHIIRVLDASFLRPPIIIGGHGKRRTPALAASSAWASTGPRT